MTPPAGAPGTASGNYRADPADHTFQPTALEPGARPRCRTCGAEKTAHTKGSK